MDELNTEITEETKIGSCDYHGKYDYIDRILLGKRIPHKCPKCVIEQERKKKEHDDREARFMKGERIKAMFKTAAIPTRFAQKDFDSYKAESDGQKKALAIAEKYAEKWPDRFDQGGGVVMCGMPGTGKTHLAAAIARSVINQGGSAVFTSVMKLSRDVKSTYSKTSERTELDVLAKYQAPDLLIIDEVGVQYGSEAEKIILFEVLNGRYEEVLPTIIISNLPVEKLPEYLGDRVIDRMTEGGGAMINFSWESYRKNVRDIVKKGERKEYDPDGNIAASRREFK